MGKNEQKRWGGIVCPPGTGESLLNEVMADMTEEERLNIEVLLNGKPVGVLRDFLEEGEDPKSPTFPN